MGLRIVSDNLLEQAIERLGKKLREGGLKYPELDQLCELVTERDDKLYKQKYPEKIV